ncbi:MAG: LysR family transcriptional regulator [Oceanospirillales bacterium]|nr:LysR family transcriptional regulator [Oceanospirillales bacterium]MBR9886226.1 LysR family transcriptional regulator [Oceanospirillales bacterium]
MNKLSPRALEYLNAVARFGSLRKAAAKLSVDPSAISRLLTQLEEEVGLPLWERSNQGSRITMVGNELLDHYRQVQASEASTLSRIQDLQGLRKGEVKIAVGEGFIADLISAPLQSFISRYPGIQISIESAGANEAVQLIKDDQVDFGIIYACPESSDLYCHVEKLHPLDLIAPPNHPLVITNQPVELKDICQHPLALIDSEFGMGRLVRLAEEIEHIRLTPGLCTNSVSVLKNFVASGLGIAFMPQLTVAAEIRTGIICAVPVNQRLFTEAKAKVVSHNRRKLTLPAEALMQHLQASMSFLNKDAPPLNSSK